MRRILLEGSLLKLFLLRIDDQRQVEVRLVSRRATSFHHFNVLRLRPCRQVQVAKDRNTIMPMNLEPERIQLCPLLRRHHHHFCHQEVITLLTINHLRIFIILLLPTAAMVQIQVPQQLEIYCTIIIIIEIQVVLRPTTTSIVDLQRVLSSSKSNTSEMFHLFFCRLISFVYTFFSFLFAICFRFLSYSYHHVLNT